MFQRGSTIYKVLWTICAVVLGIGVAFLSVRAAEEGVAFYDRTFGASTAASSIESSNVSLAEATSVPASDVYNLINHGSVDNKLFSVTNKGKSLYVHLDTMKLDLYRDGEQVAEYDIVSKGKPGSPWETPPGAYAIETKEENHFSSIGKVWMPYSMQFFGNFFIHGWPYYPNGQAVPKGYSGGCIRLTTEDAEKVYEFVDLNTTVYISGGENPNIRQAAPNTAYYLLNNYAPDPNVSASSYLVADLDTGEVILEKNQGMSWPIASVTKLTTALTSLEVVNQYKTAVVSSPEIATYGDAGHLYKGEELTAHDLLYPLLLESSNDAAEVIADQVGRDYFMKSMNDKARSIGLTQTHYEDPSGLTPKNVSTAEDLFRLLSYIYKYKSYILEVTRKSTATVGNQTWVNNNKFVHDKNYLGGKNGYTDEAAHTLVTTFSMPLSEFRNRNVAIILLHSANKQEDARAILKYLLANVYYGGNKDGATIHERGFDESIFEGSTSDDLEE